MATKELKFGVSKADIISEGEKLNAKYVIFWVNHYRGNAKGYYQTFTEFKSNGKLDWHIGFEDRGVERIIITTENVPNLIAKKKKIVDKMDNVIFSERKKLEEAYKKYPSVNIDGRWGMTNPKRIAAVKEREKRRLAVENIRRKTVEELNKLRKDIQKYSFISSSMWHYIPPKTK